MNFRCQAPIPLWCRFGVCGTVFGGNHLRFSVSDNGCGFDIENVPGIEAVEAAQSLKSDVVIMDLVMPESCRNSKPPTAPKPSQSHCANIC